MVTAMGTVMDIAMDMLIERSCNAPDLDSCCMNKRMTFTDLFLYLLAESKCGRVLAV
jgi:hypothetical protein